MPSVLTHFEFYKQAFNKLDIGIIGTQGPDPFFYYGKAISPTKSARELRKFGTFLHKVDPAVTFKYLLEYIEGSCIQEKEVLITYLKGMIAHYILDKTCHPYIWYKSGFVTPGDNNKFKYFKNHADIESAIDVLLMDHFKDKTKTYEAISFNKKDLKIVSKMIYSLGRGCYKNKFIRMNSFYKAVKSMHFVNKALYDKNGKKKAFLDKYFGFTPASPMCEPQLSDIKLDFLNLEKKNWSNVVDNKVVGNFDFYELFFKALDEFKKVNEKIDLILKNKKSPSYVYEIFREINHDGIGLNQKLTYFDCIFK